MKKVGKIVKLHILPCLVCAVLLFSPLSVAHAAVWEGSATTTVYYWGLNADVKYRKDNVVTLPYIGGNDYDGFPIVYGSQVVNGIGFDTGTDYTFSSDVDVYISGFPWAAAAAGDTITKIGNPFDEGNYEVTYQNLMTGGTGTVSSGLKEITSFNPSVSDSMIAYPTNGGIEMRMQFAADDAYTISGLKVVPVEKCGWSFANGKPDYYTNWRYTSIRIITASSSAELDELSNVADQIIAGNEILAAMKGDVVAILQDIYRETMDIEIAADRTVDLLDTMLGYVDGIEGQLTDIYGLLSGFFTSITKLLRDQHSDLMGNLADFQMMVDSRLYEIYAELSGNGTNGEITEGVQNQIGEGNLVQEGLGELDKIDPDAAVDNLYTPNGETEEFASVLSSFFENSLVMTMLMVSLSMSFVAYVLYGKR